MSAERQLEIRPERELATAEVIYVVIPAQPTQPRRHSRRDSWLDRWSGFWFSHFGTHVRYYAVATIESVVIGTVALILLYGVYTVKSMMGVDLFPGTHLSDVLPVRGYGEW